MKSVWILCVDDEIEVLRAVESELTELEQSFPLETAQSVEEAEEVIERIYSSGDLLGVIFCDHIMPERNGVDLLIAMQVETKTKRTRKVLVTGQAGLEATIQAVNESRLDYFVTKPWEDGELANIARTQLTEFVVKSHIDPTPYLNSLYLGRLSESIHEDGLLGDE